MAQFHQTSSGHRLAFEAQAGSGPTVVWLGGFNSDMTGTKAVAVHDWAIARGQAYVRFDYFGHGQSDGTFQDGTISRWREDALDVLDHLTHGPLVLVGSSMGGWMALLAQQARPNRVKAMCLIAPAPDFTEALMWDLFPPEVQAEIWTTGQWMRPSAYGEPYPITRDLIEDGRQHLMLDQPIGFDGPVRILQGQKDEDVPWPHAVKLSQALTSPDVRLTLIKDGDHRLSTPQDLALLTGTLDELVGP